MISTYQNRKLNKMAEEARSQLSLAKTYLEDGAPFSAARCYRDAADALVAWGNYRNKLMDVK